MVKRMCYEILNLFGHLGDFLAYAKLGRYLNVALSPIIAVVVC